MIGFHCEFLIAKTFGPSQKWSVIGDGSDISTSGTLRLYRGLKCPYKPELVGKIQAQRLSGTDFTDCPFAALQFARGSKGTVLVLDVPEATMRFVNPLGFHVSEELWFVDGRGPRRFMVWGQFDVALKAQIPAKQLRAEILRKGIRGLPEADKARILKRYINEFHPTGNGALEFSRFQMAYS